MGARIQFYDDTLREMAIWAARRYDLKRVSILFCNGIDGKNQREASGCTMRTPHGGFVVELNNDRTISNLTDVLAHELAHVVTMKRRQGMGHGRRFTQNLQELVGAWNRHAATVSGKGAA